MRPYAPLAALLLAMPAQAAVLLPGFDATQLPSNDDDYTGAQALGFSVNYFGRTYSAVHVGNNGTLTFGAGQGDFTPKGLGPRYEGLPIIAPFFADVDTRGGNSANASYGAGQYGERRAFGATWAGVGRYFQDDTLLNTFQAVLVQRADTGAGDFDIVLSYGPIAWDAGEADGASEGVPGRFASAGFNAGTGTAGSFFELPGSGEAGALLDGGALSLAARSNVGEAGRYVFPVRGGVAEAVASELVAVPVAVAVPEPAGMAVLGSGLLGLLGLRRRAGCRR